MVTKDREAHTLASKRLAVFSSNFKEIILAQRRSFTGELERVRWNTGDHRIESLYPNRGQTKTELRCVLICWG